MTIVWGCRSECMNIILMFEERRCNVCQTIILMTSIQLILRMCKSLSRLEPTGCMATEFAYLPISFTQWDEVMIKTSSLGAPKYDLLIS